MIYYLQNSFFFVFMGWGATKSTCFADRSPSSDGRWLWSSWWDLNWQGKPRYSEKPTSVQFVSILNPTWCALDRCRGRQPTNLLSIACNTDDTNFSANSIIWQLCSNARSAKFNCCSTQVMYQAVIAVWNPRKSLLRYSSTHIYHENPQEDPENNKRA
jgi:hypothetical protein